MLSTSKTLDIGSEYEPRTWWEGQRNRTLKPQLQVQGLPVPPQVVSFRKTCFLKIIEIAIFLKTWHEYLNLATPVRESVFGLVSFSNYLTDCQNHDRD